MRNISLMITQYEPTSSNSRLESTTPIYTVYKHQIPSQTGLQACDAYFLKATDSIDVYK